ncbi:TPR domain-containing protein [Burkholderia lata]|uniref:tetratricopeptide repeat protein n=1 Tax=Burkholderia lata (strain ATCC 17760 / DSM 23089 / LMG 22485 / NCIMB 9086 / R18194 / 383) TaxID=482957 RepID=UPI001452AE76|nr:tetratricopeptide repeat protein [Burkholderia lata]VWB93801.1 TPR domain-containing protein [Burkholderia lata]
MTPAPTLAYAGEQHLAGNLPGARTLYETLLAGDPGNDELRMRLGILELQCGNAAGAIAQLDRAVSLAPHDARHQVARGHVLHTLGRHADAADALRTALAIDPLDADTQAALGNALQALGDHAGAIDAYDNALALDPLNADVANNLGNSHRQRGAIDAAEHAYRTALAAQPDHALTLTNLGTLLDARGLHDDALRLLHDAVKVAPDAPASLINLGAALCARCAFAAAAAHLAHAAALAPHDADAAYNLGNALLGLGRHAQAADQYRRAIALRPGHADALNNLGTVCERVGDTEAAARAFDAALLARPGFVAAHNNAANLLRRLGRHDDAIAHLRGALAGNPDHSATHNHLGNVLKDDGALDAAIDSYRRALACDPDNAVAHSNLVYALHFQSEHPEPVLAEALNWSARHETPGRALATTPAHARAPDARLRIGYVGADFREHCQALFLVPLLSHHDRRAFEITCYASVARPDALTARLAGHADHWHDVHGLDDDALAQRIRDDGIDILVDLTMHMAEGRPGLFAHRPAPIQAIWLAYPGTSGLASIDFRLTDPHLDPPGHDDFYRERSIRLADTFWCYDPLADTPAVGPLPALDAGHVTFGCLNNPCKLTDRTLRLWAGLFARLPGARLVVMAPQGAGRIRLVERLRAHGIEPARVDCVPYRPRADYLATYLGIDIALDTFPYNGHTTTLDALWMGVPVVSRVGRTAVGRGGLSQLANLGLQALAAGSDAAFVDIAAALVRDLPALAALRGELRARVARSPLMDGARFAREIEAAYRRMRGVD